MELPVQFDNISHRVVDDLKERLTAASRISVAAASFSIYACEVLKKELESVQELRFIFTSPAFNKSGVKQQREFYIPKLSRERNLYGSEFEIRLRNQLSQKAVARECAEWIRRKVCFKSNVSQGVINGFMNVADINGVAYTYFPFNELTTTELGCEQGNNLCPGIMRLPSPFAEQYLRNFNELWRDKEKFQDVTDAVIENIETVYRENAPEFIYFVTLYNIFHEFLDDISEDVAQRGYRLQEQRDLGQALQLPKGRSTGHHQQIGEIQRLHPCRQCGFGKDVHGLVGHQVLREPQQVGTGALPEETQ